MIEKKFGKKRVIRTGIAFAVIWAISMYQTFVSPEYIEGSRFRVGINFFAYFGPPLFVGATFTDWMLAKKKSKNNTFEKGDKS